MKDNSLGFGVVYSPSSFAGFLRRFIIITIDLAIIYAIYHIGVAGDEYLYDAYESYYEQYCFYGASILIFFYMTVLKSSKYDTLGLALTKCKIVTLYGEKPKILRMTFRFFFLLVGPFNFLLDFMWISLNPEKRTLRDCFCGTYVIKKGEDPIGTAPVHLYRIYTFGMILMYPTVATKTKT